MAVLATQAVPTIGLAATYTAVSASDQCATGDNVVLHIKNSGGSSTTVTLTTPMVVDSTLSVQDRTVTVPAAGDRFISVPDTLYRDPATGLATFTCSPTTSVTAAVLAL